MTDVLTFRSFTIIRWRSLMEFIQPKSTRIFLAPGAPRRGRLIPRVWDNEDLSQTYADGNLTRKKSSSSSAHVMAKTLEVTGQASEWMWARSSVACYLQTTNPAWGATVIESSRQKTATSKKDTGDTCDIGQIRWSRTATVILKRHKSHRQRGKSNAQNLVPFESHLSKTLFLA